jgi:hypothetical protein
MKSLKQTLSELERKFMPQIANHEQNNVIRSLKEEGVGIGDHFSITEGLKEVATGDIIQILNLEDEL